MVAALLYLTFAAQAQVTPDTTNQLPNPDFFGTSGTLAGDASGSAPAQWRAFGVGGSMVSSGIVPLAPDILFPGSPAVNAVSFTVDSFGSPGMSDAGFDTSPVRFSLLGNRPYVGSVYLRTFNQDDSDQSVTLSLPVFDQTGTFTGMSTNIVVTATNTWTEFSTGSFQGTDGFTAEFAIRLNQGGSFNSVLIAAPRVDAQPLENRVPNPGFQGSGGTAEGLVTGDVPDFWRAFGLDPDTISLEAVPLMADELYPGSPATNAMKITTSSLAGAGFDHETSKFSLEPADRNTWAGVWMRSDNMGNSSQDVNVAVPVFDDSMFLGRQPGSFSVTVTGDWNYFGGPSFSEVPGTFANIAFRLVESGMEDSILIALPRINGLKDEVFENGFE
ncbi:MAG: hypothetical protein QNJ40_24455 [Xanthomonadales bacterium]|nr:hypothetical protein [Xanthomonadales bacterium]